MDINNYFDFKYLLAGLAPALEFETTMYVNHEIMVLSSSVKTSAEKEKLQELMEKARVSVNATEAGVEVDVHFISIPKDMEDYASMIEDNVHAVIVPDLKSMIEEHLESTEIRNQIYNGMKQYVVDCVNESLRGVL